MRFLGNLAVKNEEAFENFLGRLLGMETNDVPRHTFCGDHALNGENVVIRFLSHARWDSGEFGTLIEDASFLLDIGNIVPTCPVHCFTSSGVYTIMSIAHGCIPKSASIALARS